MHIILIIGITIMFGIYPGIDLAGAEQAAGESPSVWKLEESEWMPFPDLFPAGGSMTVMYGNPAAGPADFYFRIPAGYVFPWHFHTPVERVLVDQGTMKFTMHGSESTILSEGGYIRIPERVPHQVICMSESECLFYLVSEGPFDIHLVDENGQVTRSWKAGS